MEVFLHNLPPDLSKDGLKDQLAPFIRTLAILDWNCEKPRKKRFGHIVFLNQVDGEHFLNSHGEEHQEGYTRLRSRLMLLGFHVFCKKSNRDPDGYTLRHLAHEAQERVNPTRVIEEQGNSISFRMIEVSCGYTRFDLGKFEFAPEVEWPVERGSVTFKRRNIIAELGDGRIIRIPLNTVFEVVWTTPSSRILVTTTDVPSFFRREDNSYVRLPSLGDAHPKYVGQCLVYEFGVSPVDFQTKMNQLTEWDLAVIRHSYHSLPNYEIGLSTFMAFLKTHTHSGILPFGVLFQLQALVYNAYLPPHIVVGLGVELVTIFKARKQAGKRPISVNSLKRLFNLIGWPSPFGNTAEFTVNGLLEMITGSDQELHDGVIQADSLFRPSPHMAYIHKVMVTPSRITLHGPEAEPLNRILRRFPNHHEYFIRVQFCDENGQDLHFSPRVNNKEIFARFKGVFQDGIQIAGRVYTFLGFSHSSLRSHSSWVSLSHYSSYHSPFTQNHNLLEFSTIVLSPIRRR